MRRAALAGVATIEHGDGGDVEVFKLMAERGVALCPTLAAFEASARYRGYRPGTDPEPPRLKRRGRPSRRRSTAGVTIANGSDMGVFAHGDGAREIELLVEYGMKPAEALRAVDLGRRQDHRVSTTASASSSRGCWPTSSPSRATRPATSRPSARSSW